ncbi:hypothetical protein SADUNF_Sadunf11G0033000 [Salix dunnii]|uniref:Uncharacterized protein n=1 Tax=Salix dunnii TaxID=1413687 RepID=A0A835JSS5_9ROSI|nr:hypothetical protein SADUNF_Sadunf11G0033000 [Salix dunnii]
MNGFPAMINLGFAANKVPGHNGICISSALQQCASGSSRFFIYFWFISICTQSLHFDHNELKR